MSRIYIGTIILFAVFFLSGCSLVTTPVSDESLAQMKKATVLKSVDKGETWEPRNKAEGDSSLSGVNVLSMKIDRNNPETLYLGTTDNGIAKTENGGELWGKISFPSKVYGLDLNPGNSNMMYASGILNGRAKIYRRDNPQAEWDEIYTEPAEGTMISILKINPRNPNEIFAATSEGMIIKSNDGGNSWKNLYKDDNYGTSKPIVSIQFDAANPSVVYFGFFQGKLLVSFDNGETLNEVDLKLNKDNNYSAHSFQVHSLIADPYHSGVVYVGTGNGLMKSTNAGQTWNELNLLESSRKFSIRAIAINPKNSQEILYVAGKAIYKTVDGGNTWSTFQLDTDKNVATIVYNPANPDIIYAGLRNF